MKYPTLRFVFDRRKVASKERKASVYLEVAFQRKRRDIPTNIHLYSDEWDNKKRVINRTDSVELNVQLDETQTRVRKVLMNMQENKEEFTFEKFDVYMKGASFAGSFTDFLYDRIVKRRIQDSTRRQHFVVYNFVEQFGKIKTFKDLTPPIIKAFDDFLKEEKQKRTQATIHGIHRRLKPYIREAYELGYIKENPYEKFKVSRGKIKEREFLSMDEIRKLRNKNDLSESLSNVRDLFLFGCYTGMAYSDIKRLNPNTDIIIEEGNKFINGQRQKTNTGFYIMLLPQALEILEKHKNKLPVISLEKYNLFLKALALTCGINKKLTSHIARHTFATTITLANDIPIEIVSKMLGHTSIKTTQIYAKVLNKSIGNHMEKLSQKLK